MNAPLQHGAIEAAFHDLATAIAGMAAGGESWTATYSAEVSDFVRFNRGRVRQPGTVVQHYLELDLVHGAKHATARLALAGDPAADRAAVAAAMATARAARDDLADDPHLLFPDTVVDSRDVRGGPLPPAEAIVDTLLGAAPGLDLVGFYAGGTVYRGFANAMGQRNWHQATSYDLQWSLYDRADKAVKSGLSGFAFDERAFAAKMDEARAALVHVAKPSRQLEPGAYRAYLAPAAVEEIVSLLCWGGFSGRALATKQSPLTRMQGADGLRLDPRVSMTEATADGVAPRFQAEGFARPARVPLIEAGVLAGSLVAPRTAREFGLEANGASGWEMPEALAMAGGDLPAADALAALGTGLYVGNLWYLNYSDRPACRFTGMTRFATFWVERGRIVAPIDVLRFDDTLARVLGSSLEALTRETELMLSTDTYRQRSLASMRLPGLLLSELAFTL
jgi:predicted Zn-dependent protease